MSGLVDLAAMVALLLALGWPLSRLTAGSSQALARAVYIGLVVAALVVWPATFEAVTRGRSPGKFALGLRVMRLDGGPTAFQHALARALVAVVEIQALGGVPALVSAVASDRRQRMGDRLAGTMVVTERARWRPAPPPAMPPHLVAWAAAADLAAVPDDALHWAAQALGRGGIEPDARERALHDAVLAISPWVLPAPPPASDAEIIAAVLAERRRRADLREERRARVRARLVGAIDASFPR